MPVKEVLICSVCGEQIEPNVELGDRQGGVYRIVHPGYAWQITLCPEHVKPLFGLYERFVDQVLQESTALGMNRLDYLPVRK